MNQPYTREEIEIAKAIMLNCDSAKDKILALGAYYCTKDLADEYNMRNAIDILGEYEKHHDDKMLGGLIVLLRDSDWDAYYEALGNALLRKFEIK